MNREELFAELKLMIEAVLKEGPRFLSDAKFKEDWVSRHAALDEDLHKLDPDDILWINEEYGKWLNHF